MSVSERRVNGSIEKVKKSGNDSDSDSDSDSDMDRDMDRDRDRDSRANVVSRSLKYESDNNEAN